MMHRFLLQVQAAPLTRQFASKARKATKTLIKPKDAKAPHRSRGPSHAVNKLLPYVDDGKTYRVVFASILERLPLILPDMEPWEEDYYRMKHKIELKEALRLPKDFWFQEPGTVDVEPEDAPFLSEWNEDELVGDGFQIAKRETEDDATNNRHSLNRALKQRVFLIVQDPTSLKWTFPTTEKASADETMRAAAFRELADTIGTEVEAYPVGNAPMGHLTISHEDEPTFDGKVHGTKVFFLKAQTFGNEGVVNLNKDKAADYLWVTQSELAEYLEPHVADVVVKVVPP
ncbi:hypothetical protein H257_01019 [Aphanomyces astaci]|uniref:Large ribosomal subunit protein mL46 n=1 Tax=Aphanomyces astaci TaxID=112090 RepID=W4H5Z8_APHAT|nr:hypothetical protein H257_01019 [Aphanomyces astaci]ETV87450.1 hypothetical protein H257_01019 [Aphanomyces astaci]RHY04596.1 hypothetical protein DYB36_004159 [Aphanomyces astaci]RHY17310.1 hypothetical protein DYB25_003179 [Aphanomyces astaci]RHY50521.1 hypothetical protein DYB38_003314 [Aphanomyces astaci]RHY58618.1 hypothetical protein DYB30_005704 [Aphanomyces astaci]|eukprot:XP_009822313.1 hypothetical protein H257_01019 [Aphanomyces astaci]